jgi:hypothetical protein
MMLPVSLQLIDQSKVLLFSIDLGEIHFEEMSCSLHLNPNIFANDFEYLLSFVLLLLYHQFSISVPGKLSFLQYVKAEDTVYDSLVFDFALFKNSF